MNVSNAYKHIICTHYDIYCKYNKIEWKKPRYKQDNRAIQLPHTEKVEALIHGAKSPLCIKLGLSAKTGLRPIELYSLQVKHIDLTKRQIYPATAKNGLARVLTIDQTLADQLATYIQKNNLTLTDKLFKGNQQEYCNAFRRYRNRMANKLKDPSLKLIRLYDLRHYFCSMLFAKTNSLPYVSQQMGHKHIDTTMRYTHLVAPSNEYTSDVATTPEQARKLIDSGFEYVQTIDNIHIYRKRKILF
jgi:integrase